MHTGLKLTLVFVLGILVGLIVAVPGALFLLRSSFGQSIVRSYIVQPQSWPDVTTLVQQSGGTLTPAQQQILQEVLTTSLGIKVPTQYASAEYANALNNVFGDLQKIATSTNELGPVLIQMNNQSLAGNFNGFFDLVVKAKLLVAEQKGISTNLAQDLSSLASANAKVNDAVTRSLTETFLADSTEAPRDLNAYLASLDQILSGSVPSVGQIDDMGAKATVFTKDLSVMGGSFQKILAHFGSAQTSGQ